MKIDITGVIMGNSLYFPGSDFISFQSVAHWNITNRFKSCGVMVSMWYIVVEATCLPSDC